MIFPERPDEWPDLDQYYFRHKRPVLAGVLFCKLGIAYLLKLVEAGGEVHGSVAQWVGGTLGISIASALMLFAVLAKGKSLNIALLVLLMVPIIGLSG